MPLAIYKKEFIKKILYIKAKIDAV